jgi:long-chain acyl-CoA synthetase
LIKRIYLTLDPFTVDNGCLTPTLKIRRSALPFVFALYNIPLTHVIFYSKDAYNKFKQELDALYALGEPSSGAGTTKL